MIVRTTKNSSGSPQMSNTNTLNFPCESLLIFFPIRSRNLSTYRLKFTTGPPEYPPLLSLSGVFVSAQNMQSRHRPLSLHHNASARSGVVSCKFDVRKSNYTVISGTYREIFLAICDRHSTRVAVVLCGSPSIFMVVDTISVFSSRPCLHCTFFRPNLWNTANNNHTCCRTSIY